MATNLFRTLALALRAHVSDTYALLNAADELVPVVTELVEQARSEGAANVAYPEVVSPDGNATYDFTRKMWNWKHDALVDLALSSDRVMEEMAANRKINAIKELRALSKASLKETKDAVEDERVTDALQWYFRDPEPLADWERELLGEDPPF